MKKQTDKTTTIHPQFEFIILKIASIKDNEYLSKLI